MSEQKDQNRKELNHVKQRLSKVERRVDRLYAMQAYRAMKRGQQK